MTGQHGGQAMPLALLGRSEEPSSVRLAAYGRTPMGRARLQLELEVKRFGQPFDGFDTIITGDVDSGSPILGLGSRGEISELIGALEAETGYHWRLRILSEDPFWKRSPWLTLPGPRSVTRL